MQITWNGSGSTVYLVDDFGTSGGGQKIRGTIEQLGLAAQEQVVQLAFSASVVRFPRGNTAGDCVFTALSSYTTRTLASAWVKGEIARVNQQGTLAVVIDSTTITMPNAVLRSVTPARIEGALWVLRYTFGISTIT